MWMLNYLDSLQGAAKVIVSQIVSSNRITSLCKHVHPCLPAASSSSTILQMMNICLHLRIDKGCSFWNPCYSIHVPEIHNSEQKKFSNPLHVHHTAVDVHITSESFHPWNKAQTACRVKSVNLNKKHFRHPQGQITQTPTSVCMYLCLQQQLVHDPLLEPSLWQPWHHWRIVQLCTLHHESITTRQETKLNFLNVRICESWSLTAHEVLWLVVQDFGFTPQKEIYTGV